MVRSVAAYVAQSDLVVHADECVRRSVLALAYWTQASRLSRDPGGTIAPRLRDAIAEGVVSGPRI